MSEIRAICSKARDCDWNSKDCVHKTIHKVKKDIGGKPCTQLKCQMNRKYKNQDICCIEVIQL